jgi:glycosyltransferase involved in cell wall biosynthesis
MKKQKRIKILLDHQIFTMQTYGGISRMFVELYKEFEKSTEVEPILPILFSDNEYIKEIKKVWSIFPKNKSFVKKLLYYVVNRIYSTFVLLKGDYDIFQPTYYDPYFLPFLRGKPFVLVVYDMTHEIFPENVSIQDRTIEWKKKLVHKANRIVAISENTKKDIVKFYNIDKSKIDVVYLASSMKLPKKELDIDLPNRYILFVGNRSGYKNFEFFFKSISNILEEDKELYLVCAGSSSFTEKEIDMFNDYMLVDKVKHIKFKSDEELAYMYSKAICFVFPSLYEGFGIPVLEAFACNCPVVLSNTSSLPEVGGDAVVYFNPKDEKSIEEGVRKVIYDCGIVKDLIEKGLKRLQMFSYSGSLDSFKNSCLYKIKRPNC